VLLNFEPLYAQSLRQAANATYDKRLILNILENGFFTKYVIIKELKNFL
jgi:hypothetical protein